MGGPTVHSVRLHREYPGQPWGIRLVGGVDLNAPLVITRCQVGSPAEGELHRGDVIRKINEYDSRDLRHKDAQSLFRNAGNTIDLVVIR
ncbi:PDZ and LIM domain protein Zasp [Frankliniella fusca]|uniref:PDZ and LIM domain protein Zasp n=1 Tax=Frankliniella fusca TaxID=407009 RepID=A0AAE1HKH3_9NEOP|nr:PDZ and LIM domain protein Zasp [Frankliniella fusca]